MCGVEQKFGDWDKCLAATEESPYRKGYRVFHCGDETKHARLRDDAAALPGGEAPRVKGTVQQMKKDELATLGRLPW